MGAACVRRLAAEGARVVITDAKAEMGEALAARLRGEGHDVVALPDDVMDEAGFDDALDRAIAHVGSVDVPIDVAGGSYHACIADIALDQFDRIYRLNVRSTVQACQKVLPAMRQGRNGIRADAICPGTTASERLRNFLTPERMREFASAIALYRVGTPDEQAAAILFLASDDASTGATLVVDGGLTARGWQPTDFDCNHGLVRGG